MDRMEVEIGGTCDTYDRDSNREPLEYFRRCALERLVHFSLTQTPNFFFYSSASPEGRRISHIPSHRNLY
jgi:hypothetical protein